MLYRFRHQRKRRSFDRAIAGILDTPPLALRPGPCTIVSMVANWDVAMYLLALKSVYPKLPGGGVVAILARSMPQAARDTLARHVPGIELVTLEEIPTEPCQRGGTWERLLFILGRTERSYVIQMDADILCVADDLEEVAACVRANRSFAITDGFALQSLPAAAAMAEATPSNYIGITTERAFAHYPGGERLRYLRASSGFAGFARDGFSRAQIDQFHQTMETLVGAARWREWGTEQCASNFAVANAPDPVVLPNPEYTSFTPRALRGRAKLFHFIGTYRYDEGYFAAAAARTIGALNGAAYRAEPIPARRAGPIALLPRLVPGSIPAFLRWSAGLQRVPLTVQCRQQPGFRGETLPGVRLSIRDRAEAAAAQRIVAGLSLLPPVWIPPERVGRILDFFAETGVASAWFLVNYWRSTLLAVTDRRDRLDATLGLNGVEERCAVVASAAIALASLGAAEIDLARLVASPDGLASLELLHTHAIGVLVIEPSPGQSLAPYRAWLEDRLYRVYEGNTGTLWAYRAPPWCKPQITTAPAIQPEIDFIEAA